MCVSYIIIYSCRMCMRMCMFKNVLWKFALLCVPVRFLMVYIAMRVGRWSVGGGRGGGLYFKAMGVVGLMIGIGFMYLHFSGMRPLSVAGDKAWWNRMVHSVFYLAFGVRALMGDQDAYLFLLGDVVYGIGSFVKHHVANGDFQKLLR